MKRIIIFLISVVVLSGILRAQDGGVTKEQYKRMVDYAICVAVKAHLEKLSSDSTEKFQNAVEELEKVKSPDEALTCNDLLKIVDSVNNKMKDQEPISSLHKNYDKWRAKMSIKDAINSATSLENSNLSTGDAVPNAMKEVRKELMRDMPDNFGVSMDTILFSLLVLTWLIIAMAIFKFNLICRKLKSRLIINAEQKPIQNDPDVVRKKEFKQMFNAAFKEKYVLTAADIKVLVQELLDEKTDEKPSKELEELDEKITPEPETPNSGMHFPGKVDNSIQKYYAEPIDAETRCFQRVTSNYDRYLHVYMLSVGADGKGTFTLCEDKSLYPSFIANKADKLTSCDYSGKSLDMKDIEVVKEGKVEKDPSGKFIMTQKMNIKFK